jgi:hypothetical protein
MSTAQARMSSPLRGLVAILEAALWLVLAVVIALGGAGLVGEMTHPPGGASRAELTYPGDRELAVRLDDASSRLQQVSASVDQLSADAESALGDLARIDGTSLTNDLAHGTGSAAVISTATSDLRNSLAGLPGDGPDALVRYSNATLVRRAAILAAIDAAGGLSNEWLSVTGRSTDAAHLTTLLTNHDTTVAAAVSLGLQSKFADAVTTLAQARTTLGQIDVLRAEFSAGTEVTVLDAWVTAHARYDTALLALYKALAASGGKTNLTVQAAYREENIARGLLPTDNRSVVVIVSQLASGGLNQAVLAIQDASGRIARALAEAPPG